MPRYIDADAIKRDFQEWQNLFSWEDGATERAIISRAIQTLQNQPTADEEKIAAEYCMKHCLVMITLDTYEELIAYYSRGIGL